MSLDIIPPTLKWPTSKQWVDLVLKNFPLFLADHASNERKAASTAMDFVVRYPDRLRLVEVASMIAQQEIAHFRQVFKRMKKYNIPLRPDEKSTYIECIGKHIRKTSEERLMDRILYAAAIEMRGQERFELLAKHHPQEEWSSFFHDLALSEKEHQHEYLHVAYEIFPKDLVDQRWICVLKDESEVLKGLENSYKLFT